MKTQFHIVVSYAMFNFQIVKIVVKQNVRIVPLTSFCKQIKLALVNV